jgi:hypothetical protein
VPRVPEKPDFEARATLLIWTLEFYARDQSEKFKKRQPMLAWIRTGSRESRTQPGELPSKAKNLLMPRKDNLAPRVNGNWIGGKKSIPIRLGRPRSIYIHLSSQQAENQAPGKGSGKKVSNLSA